MERLLTTEEVAEVLRIEPVTVRRLIMRGELTAYRIAGEYRFAPADLEKFIEGQRVVVNVASKNQFGDRFTDRAREVLSLSLEEVQRYNHPAVGPEHLLLAIQREGDGIAAQVLHLLQVEPDEVQIQIEAQHPAEDQPKGKGQPGMTLQGKESIELAVQEARALDHHYIGTEHLLLGLLRQDDSLATQVLLKSGVTLEKARELVKQLLSTQQTTNEPEPEQHGES